MKQTIEGIATERTSVPKSARASIRFNLESDSNEIDESDSHDEKHDEPRISIVRGISRSDETEKLRINL
jgi:hypothetical protein